MMGKRVVRWSLLSLALSQILGLAAPAWAQGIYTCVDAKGRKITSDRPIAECMDRDQKELNNTGTVKRVVKPVMTAKAFDAEQKRIAEEKLQAEEERRRNRALLSRYPNQAAHDKERNQALNQVDEVTKAAQKRIGELAEQRKKSTDEMEFYKKDPTKAPARLKRELEENDRSVAVQKRFIADQDDEKKRVNTRFDEELSRLRKLWAQASAPAVPEANSSAKTAPKK
jgi:hypothetical protein